MLNPCYPTITGGFLYTVSKAFLKTTVMRSSTSRALSLEGGVWRVVERCVEHAGWAVHCGVECGIERRVCSVELAVGNGNVDRVRHAEGRMWIFERGV